jgi:hypothetical protein
VSGQYGVRDVACPLSTRGGGECLKARRAQVTPWTDEERTIFMEKLADFAGRPEREGLRKNFYRLSHFLPNKSTRDCIHFYYAQKKTQV